MAKMKPFHIVRWLPLSIFLGYITIVFFKSASPVADDDDRSTVQRAQEWIKSPLQAVVADRPEPTTVTVTATATVVPKSKPSYVAGTTDPHHEYRKALIVSSVSYENTSWVAEYLPDVDAYIYVNDDPDAKLTVPRNKNNEVMPYLTFLIDHYEDLPEIMVFVHAHERTHHNPPLMPYTHQLVNALNPQRVMREGYMNLNCGNWDTGKCTAESRPAEGAPYGWHPQIWAKLFPMYPLPQILAQFCCSQFAVSRDRVRQIPLAEFKRLRQTVLDMDLPGIGFFFESIWQFLFKGEHVYCPSSHQCYCDGFGICFGSREKYEDYGRLLKMRDNIIGEIDKINYGHRKAREQSKDGKYTPPESDIARIDNLRRVADDNSQEMRRLQEVAIARGKDPKTRAEELGRQWEEGDGFV